LGPAKATTQNQDLATLVRGTKEMIEEYNFGDLNLEENLVVEYVRDCDEDGCRMVVNRVTLFIAGYAVKMPDELYFKVYRICDDYANELDAFDR
jgi:hypothetical protein